MLILNAKQIKQKVNRLSYEIVEQNCDEDEIILVGLNTNGKALSQMLKQQISMISGHSMVVSTAEAHYRSETATVDLDLHPKVAEGKTIVIVDDVANTGRTLFKTAALFANVNTKRLQVAVLIDRKHKSYPIEVNYVGLSLATTINDHVKVLKNEINIEKVVFSETGC